MSRISFAGAAFLALALATPASAEVAPRHEGAIVLAQASPAAEEPAKRRRPKKERAAKREPSASQMAARERQRKCAAEWKEAKAAGKTGGLKWPKYWSQCNTRLKGNSA
jgi:hypothetical protein